MNFVVSEQKLSHSGCILIAGLGDKFSLEGAPGPAGAFISAHHPLPQSRQVFELGQLPTVRRFTLCHRYEPYWMQAKSGSRISDVPPETQFLLAELINGNWLLCVPLVDNLFRFSLRGREDQHLELLAETGDPYAVGHGGLALYIAYGSDPFELLTEGAQSVTHRLNWGRLRSEKPLPDFADTFGWCTWDAFYHEVSADKIKTGLQQFAAGEVSPKFLILDDGWQSIERQHTGEDRLIAFDANHKFGGDLSPTVAMCKGEFGITTFLVWHSIVGYWGGVSGEAFQDYVVKDKIRRFGEGIMAHMPTFNEQWWGSVVGFVSPENIPQFFDDYHTHLASQGVDGVKVDSQAVLEAVSHGEGGRVRVSRAYRKALEDSVQKHFGGRLINCMSNAQETWYGSPQSTLLRSSIDYFPNVPKSHGMHLYTNAQVGLWFGQFMQPDWDMFQSGHAWGAYHAAGRAISGGPVYVSDKPGAHDFALLRKLVCTDGSVLRCDNPGVPTRDSLCVDPTVDNTLLKIWNRNGKAGILGIFNGKAPDEANPAEASTTYEPADVLGMAGTRFACYSHVRQTLELQGAGEARVITLGPSEFELVTVVPIEHDFAPIGLVDKFNSAGAITSAQWVSNETCELTLKDSGAFLAFCSRSPHSVLVNDEAAVFDFDPAARTLKSTLSKPGPNRLRVSW